jgi:hypothetical protein
MSNQSDTGESFGTNLLTGAIIVASAFLLYASLVFSQTGQAVQASTPAAPAIEQVVVTAPRHVS